MKKRVSPAVLDGSVTAPPSKSLAIRALAAGLLSGGECLLENPSRCADAQAALAIVRTLGARVERRPDHWLLQAGGPPLGRELDCRESGLCLRLFAAVCAAGDGQFVLRARGSLARRPVGMVAEALERLGARCSTSNGCAPLLVRGPLRAGSICIDGGTTSQHLSGLLLVLPLCEGESRLQVAGLVSRPYLEMTRQLLADFGIVVQWGREDDLLVIPGGQSYAPPPRYRIESDWSAAAFLLVAGAVAGKVAVRGLRLDSRQADRAVVGALRRAGARVWTGAEGVRVEAERLRAFDFEARHCPDLVPPLAALAACCPGTSRLRGASRLRHKESDRAAALESELGKLGVALETAGDDLLVRPGRWRPAAVDSWGDHRIAMAAAVAALGGGVAVEIEDAGCVDKSYPGFFEHLALLGAEVR